jgi:serine protease Do
MIFLHRPRARILSFRGAAARLAGLCLVFAAMAAAGAETQGPRPQPMAAMPSFAPLVERVMPAVVTVAVFERAASAGEDEDRATSPERVPGAPTTPFDDFLRRFFEQRGQGGLPTPSDQRRIALGSGFIIDPVGYVVTNDHVIAKASRVSVVLQDDSRHAAKVVGRDPITDLALLKIEAKEPLPALGWGDSDRLEVGDWVLAVGNPFGLGGTISFGMVSARGRDIHAGPYDDFLQIDASLNRGNSGGPTVNLDGEVIGINTAIYSPSGGSVGVGFAIPSNQARPVIAELRERGKVERGWLGLDIQEVTPEIARSFGLSEAVGALVADMVEGGPAAKAGVRQGDVILSFNGRAIAKLRDLQRATAETAPGRTVTLAIWRERKALSLAVAVGEMPATLQMAATAKPPGRPAERASALGLGLMPLTDALRERLDLPKTAKGVVVSEIADDSPFAELDLLPGDVIQSIDNQAATTPQQVAKKLREAAPEKGMVLLINRGGKRHYVVLAPEAGAAGEHERG